MNNFYPWLNFTRQLKLNSSMIALQLKNLSWTLHEEIIHKPVWTVSVGAKNYSKPSDYGRQLGGYEHKEDIEGFKSLSRTPILEKEVTVSGNGTHMEVLDTDKNIKLNLSFEWLRENCRCSSCFNSITKQRNIIIFDIKPDIRPLSHSVNGNTLNVNWVDGHSSQYALDWLHSQSSSEKRPSEVLWSGDMSKHVAHVTATEVKSKHGATEIVKSLMEYGVGFVTDVEPDLSSTEEVIRCIGPIQHTLFGGMWQVSDIMDHLDTAYTNQALGAHTDTTYFLEPAGLIIFHCTKQNCTGGKTILVDGFRAAKGLEMDEPNLYQCLKTVKTEFRFIESGCHLTSLTTMIHHDQNDKIYQMRFNMYDRSARFPQPTSECGRFYRALRALAGRVGEPEGQWWLTLRPGTVVFINNWRVLHGRSTFQGQRILTGAYIAMGDLLSRARCLGIIH